MDQSSSLNGEQKMELDDTRKTEQSDINQYVSEVLVWYSHHNISCSLIPTCTLCTFCRHSLLVTLVTLKKITVGLR